MAQERFCRRIADSSRASLDRVKLRHHIRQKCSLNHIRIFTVDGQPTLTVTESRWSVLLNTSS